MKQKISKKRIDGFGIAKGAKPFKEEREEHHELLDGTILENINSKKE